MSTSEPTSPIHGFHDDLTVAAATIPKPPPFPAPVSPRPQRPIQRGSCPVDPERPPSHRLRERWETRNRRNSSSSQEGSPRFAWHRSYESPRGVNDLAWERQHCPDELHPDEDGDSLGSTISPFSLTSSLGSITPLSGRGSSPRHQLTPVRRFNFPPHTPDSEDVRLVVDLALQGGARHPEELDVVFQVLNGDFDPMQVIYETDEERVEEIDQVAPPALVPSTPATPHDVPVTPQEVYRNRASLFPGLAPDESPGAPPPSPEEGVEAVEMAEAGAFLEPQGGDDDHVEQQRGQVRDEDVDREEHVGEDQQREPPGVNNHQMGEPAAAELQPEGVAAVVDQQQEATETRHTMSEKVKFEQTILLMQSIGCWEDEYSSLLTFDSFNLTTMMEFIKDAQGHKKQLTNACGALEVADKEFKGEIKARARVAKLGFIQSVRTMQTRIAALEAQAAAVAAAVTPKESGKDAFKKTKVTNYKDKVISTLDLLCGEFAVVMSVSPDHNVAVRVQEDRMQHLSKRADAAVKEGRALAGDAADVNLVEDAEELERHVRLLTDSVIEAETKMGDCKATLGVYGTSTSSKIQELKPPVFNGTPSSDYFTFYKEFKEYLTTRTLTCSDQLHILKKVCLQGIAATACADMASVDEVQKYLKQMYGNPQRLLMTKVAEFKKLGDCDKFSSQKRRDWCINAVYQMESIQKLALEHKIENYLYFSAFTSEIHHCLPMKIEEQFIERMETTGTDALDKAEVFNETITFLKELITKATYEVQYELGMGSRPSKPKRDEPFKKPQPKKSGYSNTAAASTGSGGHGSSAAAQPTIQAVYQAPIEKHCKLCCKKHDYLFYCVKFQQCNVKERFKLCRATNSCMRCLRLDANVEWAKREEWYEKHQINCQTTWACREDECPNVHLRKQYHILMCTRHFAKNKTKIPAFIKQADPNRLKPATRLLFNQPLSYQMTPVENQPRHQFAANIDVIPDVMHPAVFMLQTILTPEGKQLSIFYDSGCSAAALSDYAMSCLDTQNVRPGPISMGVAGGGTVSIEGGEEKFWLSTTVPNQKASITGLNMKEITSPFPGFGLQDAFEDLQREYKRQVPDGPPLPKVPAVAGGGPVDIMLGIRYNKYFPELVFSLNCGLSIYKGKFKSPDGCIGILGGPHKSWSRARNSADLMTPMMFLSREMRAYRHECETLEYTMGPLYHEVPPLLEDGQDDEVPLLHHGFTQLGDDKVGASSARIDPNIGTFNICGEENVTVEEIDPPGQKAKVSSPANVTTSNVSIVMSAIPPDLADDFLEETVIDGRKNITETEQQKIRVTNATNQLTLEEDLRPVFYDDFSPSDFSLCSFVHCKKHFGDAWFTVPAHWNGSLSTFTTKDEIEKYIEIENSGSEISYRCIRCRNCSECRKGEVIEKSSLESERQQALMEECLTYDPVKKLVYAKLPFILNPAVHLKDNFNIAKKFLDSQILKISKKPELKEDVLKAHRKLRDKGFVVKYDDLPEADKEAMDSALGPGQFIPWSVVTKENSTTPARQVFNASAKCATGHSLNTVLAKGENRLPKLLHLLLKFTAKKHAFSADIATAYNTVKLEPSYYAYQKFLWKENLTPEEDFVIMVIITLIYGVICAGGMTTAAFEMVADYVKKHCPQHWEGVLVIKQNMYVDDALKATDSHEDSLRISKSMAYVMEFGNMFVKAFTYSGHPPDEKVSSDGMTVGSLGYLWWSEDDLISISVKDLFLGKAVRGKAPPAVTGPVKEALANNFTRRIITGKLASVFDPMGLATPITSRMKLDLSEIVNLRLGWDDPIPTRFIDTWVANLADIAKIKHLKFRRSSVHPEARSNDLEIIVSVDASETRAVACVHARSQLPDGSYRCKLVCAKNKLVSLSTIPRAELRAAVLGASLGHIVRQNFGDQIIKMIYVLDSTVVLFWLHQDQRPLQTAVRNSVIEIRRLSDLDSWYHVSSEDNVADFGTRFAEVEELGPDSDWVKGRPWMSQPFKEMPLHTLEQIRLNPKEIKEAKSEVKAKDLCGVTIPEMEEKLSSRYTYSKYVVDPCIMSWPRSVRILALVLRFVKKLKIRIGKIPPPPVEPSAAPTASYSGPVSTLDPEAAIFMPLNPKFIKDFFLSQSARLLLGELQLSSDEIKSAEEYFFIKATKEIKQFTKKSEYENCSQLKDGILLFNSRILQGQQIEDVENIMDDLSPLYFCNPLVDRYSPVAYSIMSFAHTQLVHHRNNVATLLESRSVAYILKGRELAIEVRDACVHCRRFKAKLLEVEFGKTHKSQLCISSPFFRCQVDLFGPYAAQCEHNHRATVPVWGVIFKDPSSGCIAVYALQKYNAGAFLQAYGRHVFRFSHPQTIYIDQGSQLLKACKSMEFSWTDITQTLNGKFQVGIEYGVCPVGGHQEHGLVERAVLSVKTLYNNVYKGLKLDLYGYETAFQWIASELNNLPMCLGSKYENLGRADLITPSRLMFGRSSKRAPMGYPRLEDKSRQINQMDLVAKAWWNVWLTEKLENFIPQPPKWFKTSRQPEVGDIVIFLKMDKETRLGDTLWKLGRVKELKPSNDGISRSVVLEYNNANEEVYRTTHRNVRKIAILHREGDVELVERLNRAQKESNVMMVLKQMRVDRGEETSPPVFDLPVDKEE